jgi:hypothetical protein
MKIPVFVSAPTALSADQEQSRKSILRELDKLGLEPRALGRSDYPTELPLREVLLLAKHCSGGVILGFEQYFSETGVRKRNTPEEKNAGGLVFPTPWNHLESGILFSLGLPLLVFAEDGITGGIFDHGVTDVFVHKMPSPRISRGDARAISAVFQKWQASVRHHYYSK